MENYKEKIFNIETNEESFRDYTPQEIAEVEAAKAEAEAKAVELAAKEAARQALLAKLGLTEDEAKLLLS